LGEAWNDWQSALVIVKPETVIGWHRKGFDLFWTWKVRHGQTGRPPVSKDSPTDSPDEPRESAVGLLTASFPISVTHNLRTRIIHSSESLTMTGKTPMP
jgi:hypothetical protein